MSIISEKNDIVMHMKFIIDPALTHNTIELADWPLCNVLFKNEKHFAWCVLVPRRPNITELYQLDTADQMQLMTEISRLSKIIQLYFQPDKLNIAAIGNKVPQLHIHIVGRFTHDPLWPESIWQASYKPEAYDVSALKNVSDELRTLAN